METGGKVVPRVGYVAGFDGIRALAIGLVMFAHCVIFDEFTGLKSFGHSAGSAGVGIFFVLSGYLITSILLREEAATGGISLSWFYARRALRLFPVLWLYLAVVSLIQLSGALPHHPWRGTVSALLYIRNLVGHGHETDHLWSLSIEEQFYFLWPLVLVAFPGRHRTRWVLAVVAVVAITIWRITATRLGLASIGALYMRSDFRFDAPLYGCILALTEQIHPGLLRSGGVARNAILAVTGCAGLLAWVAFRWNEVVPPGTDITIVCIFGLLLILSQFPGPPGCARWFAWRPLVMTGRISYGLYVWQQLFLGPRIPGFEVIRTFPNNILAAFTAAGLSYWCMERPLIRWKDRRLHKGG